MNSKNQKSATTSKCLSQWGLMCRIESLRFYFSFVQVDNLQDFVNILILNYKPVPDRIFQIFKDEIVTVNSVHYVFISGPDEINKIATKHKKQALTIANNLFSLRLEYAVIKGIGNWEKERDERILNRKRKPERKKKLKILQ